MKTNSLIFILTLGFLLICNISCASEITSIEHIEEHERYWSERSEVFIQLADMVQLIKDKKIRNINVMENDEGVLDLITFPEYPIDGRIKKQLKDAMLSLGIHIVRVNPNKLSFIGFSTSIGDDVFKATSLNSVYVYFVGNNDIEKDEYCDNDKFPPKSSSLCYIKLNKNWLIQLNIIVPK